MSLGIRLLLPNRMQLRWDTSNLDSQLPPDHRARLVWAFVETLDLSELHAASKPATICRGALRRSLPAPGRQQFMDWITASKARYPCLAVPVLPTTWVPGRRPA